MQDTMTSEMLPKIGSERNISPMGAQLARRVVLPDEGMPSEAVIEERLTEAFLASDAFNREHREALRAYIDTVTDWKVDLAKKEDGSLRFKALATMIDDSGNGYIFELRDKDVRDIPGIVKEGLPLSVSEQVELVKAR